MGMKPWGLLYAIPVAVWLALPCSDRQFGRGRPFFYVRQTVFASGVALVVIAALA